VKRSTTALLAALVAAVPTALAVAREDAGTARAPQATASAYAREDSGNRTGYVTARRGQSKTGAGTEASAEVDGRRAVSSAGADVSEVSIFDGLVTADRVEVTADASRGRTRTGGTVVALRVDGRRVESGRGASHDLAGQGTLAVLTTKDDGITGLDARLTKDYRGHPAGSRVIVGFARASARDGSAPAARDRPASERRRATPRRERPERRRRQRRRPTAEEREAERRAAPRLDVLPTGGGYAFPVYGDETTYSDDWGAPRQHTGQHEGNDIFAPAGTPVVAVTDGRLYRVGTRRIPGNRLWLRNSRGDTFFYAHLSAFSEAARNGADVRAGQVLGFVGSTGDAEQTPPHLHFEVHPLDGEAVNPYPFLRAWQERRDVPAAAWLTRYGADPGSRPGALVVVKDYLEP